MTNTANVPPRRLCFECQGRLRAERKTVHYLESGLDNVWLNNVPVWLCSNGHEELEIPAVDQLHDVLADLIVRKPTPLVGAEMRFLRKRLGLTAQQFAGRLGVTAVHLSRLENGRRGLQRTMDLLVRLFCAHTLAEKQHRPCPPELTTILQQLEALPHSVAEHRLRHRRTRSKGTLRQEWVPASATA
jgi:transcriptional regulator with XRE-family HTH domain